MQDRIMILYASSYGQTAKIARRLCAHFERAGLDVDCVNASEGPVTVVPGRYAAIVVGSSLIARGNQPAVKAFIEANRDLLNRELSAFFQVSASAGSRDAEGRAAAERVLHDFLAAMQWRPRLVASVAGAVKYTQYNRLLRWYMKRASARHGGATDTTRDHEYTDWGQVERFAANVVTCIRQPASSVGSGHSAEQPEVAASMGR